MCHTRSDLVHGADHRPLDGADHNARGGESRDLVAVLEAHGLRVYSRGIKHDEWRRMCDAAEREGQGEMSVFDGRVQTTRFDPPVTLVT